MPLIDDGLPSVTTGEMRHNRRTTNENGEKVIVSASDEVVTDQGWGAIIAKASEKHDNGEIVPDTTPKRVDVNTTDFPI